MHAPGVLAASCEALLPSLCLHCGEPLGGRDKGLCTACWSAVVPLAGVCCPLCAGPCGNQGEDTCLHCLDRPPPQSGTVVWGEYDAQLRTAVLALKHRGRDEFARFLGGRLAGRISLELWSPRIDLVTHIPSHPIRRLRHGRCAAENLADVVARQLARPLVRTLRRKGLQRQAGRSRAQRLQLATGSFRCIASVDGQRVLVVDDVTTTGATLRRVAQILLAAGAREVFCAAVARTPDTRRST